jgi:hypothetical protein
MHKFFRMVALVAAIAAVGLVNPAVAKPKKKQDHGHHAYAGQVYKPGKYTSRHANHHYRRPEYRYSGASVAPWGRGFYAPWYGGDRPPGWSRGVKRGWQGRPMPPGQYKKYYR